MTRVLKLAAASCLCKQWQPQCGDLESSSLLLTDFGQRRISARCGVVTLALRSYQLALLPDVSISRRTAQQLLSQGGNTLHSRRMFPHM